VRTEIASAPASAYRRATCAGSYFAAIRPADGDAFFVSAITRTILPVRRIADPKSRKSPRRSPIARNSGKRDLIETISSIFSAMIFFSQSTSLGRPCQKLPISREAGDIYAVGVTNLMESEREAARRAIKRRNWLAHLWREWIVESRRPIAPVFAHPTP